MSETGGWSLGTSHLNKWQRNRYPRIVSESPNPYEPPNTPPASPPDPAQATGKRRAMAMLLSFAAGAALGDLLILEPGRRKVAIGGCMSLLLYFVVTALRATRRTGSGQ